MGRYTVVRPSDVVKVLQLMSARLGIRILRNDMRLQYQVRSRYSIPLFVGAILNSLWLTVPKVK